MVATERAVLLEKSRLETLIVQVQHPEAYELWDSAGAIAREMLRIWPDLSVAEAAPQQQLLKSQNVQIQTTFNMCTVTLTGPSSLNQASRDNVNAAFKVWRAGLAWDKLLRVSTKGIYVVDYPTQSEANSALLNLNVVRWPQGKMFDQAPGSQKNAVDVGFRFEDEVSYSYLKLKTEQRKYELKIQAPFEPQEPKIENRLVIDFDRGLLGSVNAETFRMDDWLKGFHHILNRDFEKVVGLG